ncbi:hypothetical protein [Sinomonas sp. RB5]
MREAARQGFDLKSFPDDRVWAPDGDDPLEVFAHDDAEAEVPLADDAVDDHQR